MFESARALSAGGTALGVVGFHAISRRAGLDRREALLCSALCALCPAWMFFATIVEVHGSFMPFAALGVYALVRLVQRPSDGLAVIAGLAIGVAYLAHPTGVLLIAQLPLVAIVPYMIVSQLLILHGGEHGAYLLPVAWSMAVLALPLLRGRSLVIATLLVLSAAWGTARILKHDNPEPPTAYAEGFRDIAGERPVIAIGQQLDFAAHFLHLHDVQTIFIGKVVLIRDESGVQRFLSDLDRALADYARAGRRAFLSKGAFESLEIASPHDRWIDIGLPTSPPLNTDCATLPQPKTMRTNVPRNSAAASRAVPRNMVDQRIPGAPQPEAGISAFARAPGLELSLLPTVLGISIPAGALLASRSARHPRLLLRERHRPKRGRGSRRA